MADVRPISILVCALGGEGGGVLAEWLYGAAVRAGLPAQATSIPGVAQRTGATTYYIEVLAQSAASPQTRRPVFSLSPVPGTIDLLVSSELLETLRQVGNGMTSPQRTLVISSTARALTVAEKMQATDGRVDAPRLIATLQQHVRAAELLDLDALAREAGTAISAVLLGAIAASGVLPIPRPAFEDTIRASGKGVDASLRGFALAFETLARRLEARAPVEAALQPAAQPEVDLRALARRRLTDYQDGAYAALYEQRLGRIEAAERIADPDGIHDGAITRETCRWLALWMAFDDIVRVAALKLAASRQERVRREVGATDDEIVKVFDHFKPGVPEFAALLPQPLALRLMAWDRRRVARGLQPWALPLRVGTHTLAGALALRIVASLKGQRRRGSRFALEQSLIERWLAAIEGGIGRDWTLGHELAQCGRLIKGYGSTNERGKENLLHIVDHLAFEPATAAGAAAAVRAARTAALADEAGRALDQVLVAHGALPRPPREQAIRWYRRRPDTAPG
jgi:indolepyruvate ferredoxin oxidoreductase beta subunit